MKILLALIACISFTASAQEALISKIEKKCIEIEKYKKYKVVSFDSLSIKDLNETNHLDIVAITDYSRKGDDFGKVEETVRTTNGLSHRTYYFSEEYKLLLIRDRRSATETWSYYFDNHTLVSVIDNSRNDRIGDVDRKKLKNEIKSRWPIEIF
jgi:hypothetical protein